MNLARRLYASHVANEAAKNELEGLLYSIFPGWQSWKPVAPYGLEVFGAFESARGAAQLMAQGFETVILHDHLADEKLVTCRCHIWE